MELQHLTFNKQMFETALRRKLSDRTAKVVNVSPNCLSEKGLNFLSDLYEISVTYTTMSKNEKMCKKRTISMVMKIEPVAEIPRCLVQQQNLFLTELKFLRDALPKIKEAVRCQIGPDLFYGSDDPRVLLMENLTQEGFVIKDRQVGLSLEQCALAMQKIAKLHAGSVLILEKNPELIQSFTDTGILSSSCPKSFLRLIEVSVSRVGHRMRKWSDERCAKAAEKLIKLSGTTGTRCSDAYNYDPDEFCVLNHGDCWVNNMMFKENEKGQSVDILLVDYQMGVYTSPAIDLLYFLNICPVYDVKYDCDDYLLEIYLSTLQETMRNIGCKRDPPTAQELKEAIHKRRIYAVFSGIVLYLRMMARKEDTEDFTEVLNNLAGETKMDVFRNPDAVKLAHKMVPIMNERGYFD